MGKCLCLLVCLAVFVSAGNALKCYECNSDKIDGCIKDQSPKEQTCGLVTVHGFQNVCYYTLLHDISKKTDKVQAGCGQIYTASPVHEKDLPCNPPPAGVQMKECRVCKTDLCNTIPGNDLKCYECSSDKIDGCIKDQNPKEQTCGDVAAGFQNVCAYTILHDTSKKTDIVHSGCKQIPLASPVNETSLNICSQPPAGIQKKECIVCNTDLCNSAPGYSTNLFALLFFPVMYLFTK